MGFKICENTKIKWIFKFVKPKKNQMGFKMCEKNQKSNGFLNL